MLARYENEGIELVIDTVTGESFATISGYARMSGVKKNTLANRLARGYQGVHKDNLKLAEIETPGGIQGVHLISEGIISEWIVDDNPAIAKQLLKAGVRVYLHKLAGYQVTSTAVEKPMSSAEMFMQCAKLFAEHEQRMLALEEENKRLLESQADMERRLDGVEAEQERIEYPMGRFFTVMGYANLTGRKITLTQAADFGRKASRICEGLEIQPEKIKDQRFGRVNSYPEDVLKEVMGEAN